MARHEGFGIEQEALLPSAGYLWVDKSTVMRYGVENTWTHYVSAWRWLASHSFDTTCYDENRDGLRMSSWEQENHYSFLCLFRVRPPQSQDLTNQAALLSSLNLRDDPTISYLIEADIDRIDGDTSHCSSLRFGIEEGGLHTGKVFGNSI